MQRASARASLSLNDPEIAMVDLHQSPDSLLSEPQSSNLRRDQPLPSRVQLTVFRLLTFCTLLGTGTAKAAVSWTGGSVSVTWIDWVGGTLFAAAWYYVSLFENLNPPVATWFFHEDMSMDLFYLLSSILLIVIASFMAMAGLWAPVVAALYLLNPTKVQILDRGGWFVILLLPLTMILIVVWLLLIAAELAIPFGIVILIWHCGNIARRYRRTRLCYARTIQTYRAFNEGIMARRRKYPALYNYVWTFTAALALGVAYFVVMEFFDEWVDALP